MAKFTIVVAENDSRFVLNPRAKDEGERTTITGKKAEGILKHAEAYCSNDSRDLPYAARLAEGKRVALKLGNGMLPGIRSVIEGSKAKPAPKPEPSIEDAMAEAEARNEAMSKAAAIKRSNMSAENKAMLLSLIGA